MPITEELLKKARTAGARLVEAERELQTARSEYQAIVRRMHLAGSSLREIARTLNISHQRVQQMVQSAGGTWWQRIWRTRRLKGNLTCTFCKRSEAELSKLIAGPNVYICDACVELAGKSMRSHNKFLVPAPQDSRAHCSFCGKRSGPDRSLLTGARGNICSECLGICRQIIEDSAVS